MLHLALVLSLLCFSEGGHVAYVKAVDGYGCLGVPCKLIEYYAANTSYIAANYTFFFMPGSHILERDFVFSNSSSLNFIAAPTIGLSKPVIIRCTEPAGLVFQKVQQLRLGDITIMNCGTHYGSKDSKSALRIENAMDVVITNIHVHHSRGYGILAENVYSNFVIQYSSFSYNKGSNMYNGGNAFIRYSNSSGGLFENKTTLRILSSIFSFGNYDNINNFSNTTLATGLIIIFSYSNVFTYIRNITLQENSNSLSHGIGGNMLIHFYNETSFISNTVHIDNSRFLSGKAELGGGLAATFYTYQEEDFPDQACHNKLLISDSTFVKNEGLSGCGIYIELLTPGLKGSCPSGSIVLVNTSLLYNSANLLSYYTPGWNIAVAIEILNGYVRDSLKDTEPFSILFKNISVVGSRSQTSYRESAGSAAMLIAKFVGNLTIQNSKIIDNEMSGISLFRSKVTLSGNVLVANNSGFRGGGLILCGSSYIELEPHTMIKFVGNNAKALGGAIYSETQCQDSHPICFYQFAFLQNCSGFVKPSDTIKCYNSIIIMENNTAKIAGKHIYGGNVGNCYFHRTGLKYQVMPNDFYSLFEVEKNMHEHFSAVTSDPIKVCSCTSEYKYNCSTRNLSYNKTVYPGQLIRVLVVVVGQLNGTVPGSVLVNGQEPHSIINITSCSLLPIRVSGSISEYFVEVLNEGIVDMKHLSNPIPNSTPLSIHVNITRCPVGFVLKQNFCDCDTTHAEITSCNITNLTVTKEFGSWIGYNELDGGDYSKGILYKKVCPLDYCDIKVLSVSVTDERIESDMQCSPHRTGLLCGACKFNYSVALESTKCVDCTNTPRLYPLLVTVVMLLCSVMLMVLLTVLNVTITDGTLTGFLFYANILYSNRALFRFTEVNFLTVTISLINLDLVLNSCFFNGMDAYFKTWFQLSTPVLLWLMIIIIILLSKRFDRVSMLIGNNSVKILATLIELSFNRLLQTCIVIFSLTELKYPMGNKTTTTSYVWLYDANVEYLKGKHMLQFVAGTVLSVFLLVYTLILLFVQPLQRYSQVSCFRWVNRLKPLIDAYTAPNVIKPRCRFWAGLLLLFKILLSVYTAVNYKNKQLDEYNAIIITCTMIFAIAFITGGIYQSFWLNFLNVSFIVNLVLLTAQTNSSFYKNKSYYYNTHSKAKSNHTVAYVSSSVAILTALIVVMYKISRRIAKFFNRKCHLIKQWRVKKLQEQNPLLEYSHDSVHHCRSENR